MSAGWLLSASLLLELTIVQSGKCPAPQPAFSFSPIYTPVCGSDNLTYANVEALILRNDQAAAGQYSASLEPGRVSAIRPNDYPYHLVCSNNEICIIPQNENYCWHLFPVSGLRGG